MNETIRAVALFTLLAPVAADTGSDRLFEQAVGTKPEFTLRAGDRIVGITRYEPEDGGNTYRVTALRAAGPSWRKETERVVDDGDAYRTLLHAFAPVRVGTSDYVYFSVDVRPQGTAYAASGQVDFHLVNVQTLELHRLVFWGEERGNGTVQGQFGAADALSGHPDLLAFLKDKAAACPRIYHGGQDSMSWVDDWKAANASLPDPAMVESFGPVKIRWRYYDQELMKEHPNSEDGTQENAQFKVFSYFRSHLIGYDKARKQYFPIWTDTCAHGCNKEIRSLQGSVLAFVFGEWESEKVLYVDLKAGTVRMDPH